MKKNNEETHEEPVNLFMKEEDEEKGVDRQRSYGRDVRYRGRGESRMY